MTWRQYGEAAYNAALKAMAADPTSVPDYIPDFTGCVDHFAIHAGGWTG